MLHWTIVPRALTLVSFGSGGIREELHFLQHVDLRESDNKKLTTYQLYKEGAIM